MTLEITTKNFEETILQSDKPSMVDFYADWCGPCRIMSPKLDKLGEELGENVIVAKINVDENKEIFKKFKIKALPTIIFFKDGKEIRRATGMKTSGELKEILLSI